MNVTKHRLSSSVKTFPSNCGVYLMKNKQNHVIYVGKAKNLKSRVQSYFKAAASHQLKQTFLVAQTHHLDYVLTDTEAEALLLEANLIKKYTPRYNVRLKDDKSYPYICCSMEDDFPRFYIQRRVKKKGSLYFGPYTDAGFARKMIRFLNKQFKIRDCSNHFMKGRTSPCLVHQMGHCTAPCVRKVSQSDYQRQVKQALSILKKGGAIDTIKQMEVKMKALAAKDRFEEAARLRDFIKALQLMREKQSVIMSRSKNLDAAAFYGEDEKGFLLQTLHVRAGVVVGHRSYFLNIQSEHFAHTERLLSIIAQYYMDNVVPEIILLDLKETKHFNSLEKMLFHKNGQKITVRQPIGQEEKQLMRMAFNNARSHFKEKYSHHILLKKGLDRIQKKFHLSKWPGRMECFDVSHFQGDYAVAAHVVFVDGMPKKTDYRKYQLKTTAKRDDYLSLQEVLIRRFQKNNQEDPDLMIVDGGKGQLRAAIQALKITNRQNIPIIAMAKARIESNFSAANVQSSLERFFIPGRKNPIVFSTASMDSNALHILIHLRDEAHRSAISYHRYLSQKYLLKNRS